MAAFWGSLSGYFGMGEPSAPPPQKPVANSPRASSAPTATPPSSPFRLSAVFNPCVSPCRGEGDLRRGRGQTHENAAEPAVGWGGGDRARGGEDAKRDGDGKRASGKKRSVVAETGAADAQDETTRVGDACPMDVEDDPPIQQRPRFRRRRGQQQPKKKRTAMEMKAAAMDPRMIDAAIYGKTPCKSNCPYRGKCQDNLRSSGNPQNTLVALRALLWGDWEEDADGPGGEGGGEGGAKVDQGGSVANQRERMHVLWDHLEQSLVKPGHFRCAIETGSTTKMFVCDAALMQFYDAPESMFTRVRASVNKGHSRPLEHGNTGGERGGGDGKAERAEAWLTYSFKHFLAEPQPNAGRSDGETKGEGAGEEGGEEMGDDGFDSEYHMDRQNTTLLYEVYVDEQEQSAAAHPGHISTFRRAMAAVLLRMKIKIRTTRAVSGFCDQCDQTKKKISELPKNDKDARRLAIKEYTAHHFFVRQQRQGYAARRNEACSNPLKYLSSIWDMADQSRLTLPIVGKNPSKAADANSLFKFALFGTLRVVSVLKYERERVCVCVCVCVCVSLRFVCRCDDFMLRNN